MRPCSRSVTDRAGVGQVAHIQQLESELLGHDAHGAVGEGARDMTRRLQLLLGELLDLGEVVVDIPHLEPSSVFARRASSGVAIASRSRRCSSR
jgi:hypothetical protein